MFVFESAFSDYVLLTVVDCAQADRPAVRRFKCQSTICTPANMSAFDRHLMAARDAAAVSPDPVAVSEADSACNLWCLLS